MALSSWTVFLASSIGIILYYGFVQPFFRSPLRHVPRAHWSVPIPYLGSIWIFYHRFRSVNNQKTSEAHKKHGPVVRLGDNEISVNCYEGGLRTVYAGSWEKHEWYPRQFAFGAQDMFTTLGHAAHSAKKRTVSNIYSKSYLQTSEQLNANSETLFKDRFLPLIQSIADSGQAVDIREISGAFTMDFVTAFLFGIDLCTDFTANVEVRRKFMHNWHIRRNWDFIPSEIPVVVRKIAQNLGITLMPQHVQEAEGWLGNWAHEIFEATHEAVEHGYDKSSAGSEPLFFERFQTGLTQARSKDPYAGFEYHPYLDTSIGLFSMMGGGKASAFSKPTTKLEVDAEMFDHLVAGQETSTTTLTYLYYELSRHPEYQERLQTELLTLSPPIIWPVAKSANFTLPDPKTIDALPFLSALLQEVLRLYAPIPGMQPRVSPSVPGGVTLGPPGHEYPSLPGGIRVSAMAHTLHRIPEVFPSPETFDPDRWLTSSPEQLKEMNRYFWAFGSGGRMCIGVHLAMLELKLTTAAISTNFTTSIAPGGDDGIEQTDGYAMAPKGGKLFLTFAKRTTGRGSGK